MWQMMMNLCTLLLALIGVTTLEARAADYSYQLSETEAYPDDPMDYEGTGSGDYSNEEPDEEGSGKGKSIETTETLAAPMTHSHAHTHNQLPGSGDSFGSALASLQGAVKGWQKVYDGLNDAAGMMVQVAGRLHNGLKKLPGVDQGNKTRKDPSLGLFRSHRALTT